MMIQPDIFDRSPDRNTGLDLLKTLAMMMVVMIHVIIHGGLIQAVQLMPAKRIAIYVLYTASFCAVNCYGLISGFVGITSRQHYSSLAAQHLRVVFYSVLLTIGIRFMFPNTVSKWDILKSMFPYTNDAYWYYTAYLPTALLAPYINRLLRSLTKRELCQLAVLLVVLFSLWPMVSGKDLNHINFGYSASWILCLYVLGGILRLLDMHQRMRSSWLAVLYALAICIALASKLIKDDPSFHIYEDYSSLLFLTAAAALVLFFARIPFSRPFLRKIITLISTLSFSVYLIHDHTLVRIRLMRERFAPLAHLPLISMVLSTLLIVAGILLGCLLIDLGRKKLFDALKIHKRLRHLENAVQTRWQKVS